MTTEIPVRRRDDPIPLGEAIQTIDLSIPDGWKAQPPTLADADEPAEPEDELGEPCSRCSRPMPDGPQFEFTASWPEDPDAAVERVCSPVCAATVLHQWGTHLRTNFNIGPAY